MKRSAPIEAPRDRLMPLMELARRWGWSRSKLWRLVQRKGIPHIRLGVRNDIHFRERDVEAWLAEQTIGPKTAPRAARAAATAEADRAEMCKLLGIELDHPFS